MEVTLIWYGSEGSTSGASGPNFHIVSAYQVLLV